MGRSAMPSPRRITYLAFLFFSIYPAATGRVEFLLPDGYLFFYGVNDKLYRLEGFIAVSRRSGNNNARLTDVNPPDPVDQHAGTQRPSGRGVINNFLKLFSRHLAVGLVF